MTFSVNHNNNGRNYVHMSDKIVRIYSAENFKDKGVDVVGVSTSAAYMFEQPGFLAFMAKHEKDVHKIPRGFRLTSGISEDYRVVRPPLDDQQLQEFGQLCVGGWVDGEYREPLVDGGNDCVYVIDNRHTVPKNLTKLQDQSLLVANNHDGVKKMLPRSLGLSLC
jgi:hypothetical protein